MTDDKAYASPQTMRQAVTDRLRAIATPKGRWTLAELQRQFAYDRLLARLYVIDDSWVLKGAVALLARQVSVRHSTDIDLYRDAERTMVERELRAGAELDLGDWFRFDIGAGESLLAGTGGMRFPVIAWIGATRWATFYVDLVGTGVRMTGVPDHVPPVAEISVPGIEQPGYRAYPLVDHVADKVAAILESHGDRRPSTRFRDLIDLVALVVSIRVGAEEQRVALLSEVERRGLQLPDHFEVPDRTVWEGGFARAARHAAGPPAGTRRSACAGRSVCRSGAGRFSNGDLEPRAGQVGSHTELIRDHPGDRFDLIVDLVWSKPPPTWLPFGCLMPPYSPAGGMSIPPMTPPHRDMQALLLAPNTPHFRCGRQALLSDQLRHASAGRKIEFSREFALNQSA